VRRSYVRALPAGNVRDRTPRPCTTDSSPGAVEAMRSSAPFVIDGLCGALSTAITLAEEFEHCHAVALTDARGAVVDFLVFAAEDHTAESAIAAGARRAAQHPEAGQAVRGAVLA